MAENDDVLAEFEAQHGPIKTKLSEPEGKTDDVLAEFESQHGAIEPNYTAPEGTLKQMGKQFAAGAKTDFPKMVGEAAQAFTPEDWEISKWGKEVADSAKAREELDQPDLRDKNLAQKALIYGSRAAVPSIAAGAGYALNPVAGTVGTVALFGGSQGQETYEKMLANGASEEDARNAALLTGGIQGVGEAIANPLTSAVFGAGKKAAVEGMKGLVGRETDKAILKPYAKAMGEAMIGEPATEISQDVGTQAVEEHYGLKPEQSYADVVAQSGLGALGMTALLAPLGLAGHYRNSKLAEHMDSQLANGEADPMQRRMAVNRLSAIADKENLEGRDQWRAAAEYAIDNKLPIPRSLEEADVVLNSAQPQPEAQQPETQPEVEQPEIAEAPAANPPVDLGIGMVDEGTLNRAKDSLAQWNARAEAGGLKPEIQPGLRNLAVAMNVPDADKFTNAIDLLKATNDSFARYEAMNAPKTAAKQMADEIRANAPEGGPLSGVVADFIENNPESMPVTEQEQTPAALATEQLGITEQEQPNVVYQDLGDTGPEAYSPEWLATIDTNTLKALIKTGTNKPGTGAMINDELKRRQEAENAQQVASAGPLNGGGSTQPGIREEGGSTAERSAGVQPSGQGIGNPQQEPSEAPVPRETITEQPTETGNGESENQAEKTTAPEVDQTELTHTEEGRPKYVQTTGVNAAANIAEKNKKGLSEEQIKNGDYQRGVATIDGINIAIENRKGSLREGRDKDGKKWSQEMKSHYGEIFMRDADGNIVTGADGDLPDVFIAPGVTSLKDRPIYVVDQVDKNGNFDEHKIVIAGKNLTEAGARKAYNDNYEEGWKGLGAITKMNFDEFVNWLKHEDATKPVGEIPAVKQEQENPIRPEPVIARQIHNPKNRGSELTDQEWDAWRKPILDLIAEGKQKEAYFAAIKEGMPIEFEEQEDGSMKLRPGARFTESFRSSDRGMWGWQGFKEREAQFRKEQGIAPPKSIARRIYERQQAEKPQYSRPATEVADNIEAMDVFSEFTAAHETNVARIARDFAKFLGFTNEGAEVLASYGLTHDTGKLYVPKALLNKPGGFTQSEREVMKLHAFLGELELAKQDRSKAAQVIARLHHAKGGELQGLSGTLNSFTKIVQIADVYEALTSKDREFYTGKAKSPGEALIQMLNDKQDYKGNLLSRFAEWTLQQQGKAISPKERSTIEALIAQPNSPQHRTGLQAANRLVESWSKLFDVHGLEVAENANTDQYVAGANLNRGLLRVSPAVTEALESDSQAKVVRGVEEVAKAFFDHTALSVLAGEDARVQASVLADFEASGADNLKDWLVDNATKWILQNEATRNVTPNTRGVIRAIVDKIRALWARIQGQYEVAPSIEQWLNNTVKLESVPATGAVNQAELANLFSKLEYMDSKADREVALDGNPMKDQIEFIDQNFDKIFNALVKSDNNPDGKVIRRCP